MEETNLAANVLQSVMRRQLYYWSSLTFSRRREATATIESISESEKGRCGQQSFE